MICVPFLNCIILTGGICEKNSQMIPENIKIRGNTDIGNYFGVSSGMWREKYGS